MRTSSTSIVSMESVALKSVLLIIWAAAAPGLLLDMCPTGGRSHALTRQQPPYRRLHQLLRWHSHRRALQQPLLATTTDSSSSGGTTEDSKTKGFGSRANRRKRGGATTTCDGIDATVVILKRSSLWACVKNCGACCYLAPDERPDLAEYLPDQKELDLYMSMASDDGWCKHFDKKSRACTIYTDRPRFCRVETETFGSMYGVDPEDMDEFCSACCTEQISDVYGSQGKELRVFNEALAALERGERPKPELSAFGGDLRGLGEWQIRDWGLDERAQAEV